MPIAGMGNIQTVGINIVFRMTGQTQSAISRTESALKMMDGSFKSLEDHGRALTRAYQLMGGVLAMGGAVLLGLGKAASIAAEGLSKLQVSSKILAGNANVTYKALQSQTRGFTENAFSVTEALEATNKLNAVGATWVDTQKLAAVANDLAISKNLEYAVVLNQLTDAIARGSAESLNQLDIGVTNEKLMKRFVAGTDLSANSLSQLNKQHMVYNYILERGTFVQGAYAAATEDVSVTLRNLRTNAANAWATVGQGFLEAIQPGLKLINNVLVSISTLDKFSLKLIGTLAATLGSLMTLSGAWYVVRATLQPLLQIVISSLSVIKNQVKVEKALIAAEAEKIAIEKQAAAATAQHAAANATVKTSLDSVTASAKTTAAAIAESNSQQLTAIAQSDTLAVSSSALSSSYAMLAADAVRAAKAIKTQTAALNANTAAQARNQAAQTGNPLNQYGRVRAVDMGLGQYGPPEPPVTPATPAVSRLEQLQQAMRRYVYDSQRQLYVYADYPDFAAIDQNGIRRAWDEILEYQAKLTQAYSDQARIIATIHADEIPDFFRLPAKQAKVSPNLLDAFGKPMTGIIANTAKATKNTNLFTKAWGGLGKIAPGITTILGKIGALLATPAGAIVGIGAAIAGVGLAIEKVRRNQWKKRLGEGEEGDAQLSLYDEEMAEIDKARAEATAKAIRGIRDGIDVEYKTPRQREKAGETYMGEDDLEKGIEKLHERATKYAVDKSRFFGLGQSVGEQYAFAFAQAIDKAEIQSTHDLHRLDEMFRKAALRQAWSDMWQGMLNEVMVFGLGFAEAMVSIVNTFNELPKTVETVIRKFIDSSLGGAVEQWLNQAVVAINKFRVLLGKEPLELEFEFALEANKPKQGIGDFRSIVDPLEQQAREAAQAAIAAAKEEITKWTDSDFMSDTFLSTPASAWQATDYVSGMALKRVTDELDAAQKAADGLAAEIKAIDDALFAVEIQERNLDLALRPFEHSLQRIEAATTLIIIPLQRQRRALQHLVDAAQEHLEAVKERHQEENRALEDQIAALEKQLSLAREQLQVLDWELFIENTKNKIRKQETSALELSLKTEKLIQQDNVELMEIQLERLREELEEKKKQQELEIEAAEKQITAAEKQIEAIDKMIAAEEEKVTYAQEELELQKAMQVEQRLALEILKENLSWQQKLLSREKAVADERVSGLKETQKVTEELTEDAKEYALTFESFGSSVASTVEGLAKDQQAALRTMTEEAGKLVDNNTIEIRKKYEDMMAAITDVYIPQRVRLIKQTPTEDTIMGAALLDPMDAVTKAMDDALETWMNSPESGLQRVATEGFGTMVMTINDTLSQITWPDVPDYIQDFMKGNYPGGHSNTQSRYMPDITAASGFNGIVRRPTTILAGEAGPESVNITPYQPGSGVNVPSYRVYPNNTVNNNSSSTTIINNNFDVEGVYGQTPSKRSALSELQLAAHMIH